MDVVFDPDKNHLNFAKHGLWFEETEDLEWDTAVFKHDNRYEYGEIRFIAFVLKDNRLYVVCLTMRPGDVVRVFSFRKANKREIKDYEQERTSPHDG